MFFGCRTTTFSLGLREAYWREHVKDMLLGSDQITAPCLLLDLIAAHQFVTRGAFKRKADPIRWLWETAEVPAAGYRDLQLAQNYRYPRATYGEEPLATKLKAQARRADPLLPGGGGDQCRGGRRRGQRLLVDDGRAPSQERERGRMAVT